MRLTRKTSDGLWFENPTGERGIELIGGSEKAGQAQGHSVAQITIQPGGSSRLHYHPSAEESYFILAGEGRLILNGQEFMMRPGDTVLIEPNETHQIFCVGEQTLEFLAICAPPWTADNSIYLD